MRRQVIAIIVVAVMLVAVQPAVAADGTCEVDGEVGFSTAWGECMTPSLYDERFSVENLSTIQSLTNPSESIASEVGLVPDVPSDRPLGDGFVEETETFKEILLRVLSLFKILRWTR